VVPLIAAANASTAASSPAAQRVLVTAKPEWGYFEVAALKSTRHRGPQRQVFVGGVICSP